MTRLIDRFIRSKHTPYAFIAVLMLMMTVVGLSSSMPMVGDETAHYYTAIGQGRDFSSINLKWELVTDYGEHRGGQGTNTPGWYLFTGLCHRLIPAFAVIQLAHLLFTLQLLVFFFLLALDMSHNSRLAALSALFCLGTMAMFNLFGVAMYLDVPVTAQIVTSMYFLNRGKYLHGTVFFLAAMFIKENALLFLPPALLFIAIREWKSPRRLILFTVGLAAAAALLLLAWDYVIRRRLGIHSHTVISIINLLGIFGVKAKTGIENAIIPDIIVYPGDLRVPANWVIYPGLVFWLFAAIGGLGLASWIIRQRLQVLKKSAFWAGTLCGLFYLAIATVMIRPNFDIRYLMPGIPFLVFSLACGCARTRHFKYLLPVLMTAGLLQSAAVMIKLHSMRNIEPELAGVIDTIKKHHPADGDQALMYADKWRFMPIRPEWQIAPRLWEHGIKTAEISSTLKQHRIVFIVVDKSKLVKRWSRATANAMPVEFVSWLDARPGQFAKVVDNRKYTVYKVSP